MAEKERHNRRKCIVNVAPNDIFSERDRKPRTDRNMAERQPLAAREVIDYLRQGFNLYDELVRNSFTDDVAVAELVIIRCEEFVCSLSLLYHAMPWPEPEDVLPLFQEVIAEFQERISRLFERFNFFNDNDDCNYVCPIEENVRGRVGRPRFLIPKQQLEGLRSLHFSWQNIALMLGVSERTVRRRRSELGMTVGQTLNYSEIDDGELDVFVQRILHYSPNSGERMVIGALKGYGVKVQRERVRQSIGRIDPISRELRRRTAIHRRIYSVRTPNALWYEFLCVYIIP